MNLAKAVQERTSRMTKGPEYLLQRKAEIVETVQTEEMLACWGSFIKLYRITEGPGLKGPQAS